MGNLPLKTNDVHVPKETPIEMDEWESVFIDDEKGVSFLWDKVSPGNEKAAQAAGWNIEQVKRAIMKLGEGVLGEGVNNKKLDDWDHIQDEIKNNDITVTNRWPSIFLVHNFVREKNGNISHRIFIRDGIASLGKNQKNMEADPDSHSAKMGKDVDEMPEDQEDDIPEDFPEDFLYENLKAAENFGEKIGSLFAEVGNGLFHGVNGFGQKNYSHSVLINRIKCRLTDSLNFATSMNFQRNGEYNDDTPPLESFGSLNVFAPGIQQLQYAPRMTEALQVLGILQNNMSENNALFRDSGKQIAETETATAASILGQIQAQASQANAALFLAQLGKIYAECFRRLRIKRSKDPDAKAFQARCIKAKIPESVLYESNITVKSGASASTASPIARAQLWQELRAAARTTPGANVRYVDQMYYANRAGADIVKKIMPSNPAQTEASIINEAVVENVTLSGGNQQIVDQMHNHVVHLNVHLEVLEGIGQSAIQGNPVRPDHLLVVQFISTHVEEHLNFLSQDTARQEEFRNLNKRYNVIKQILQQVINTAISQQGGPEDDGELPESN